MALRNDGAYLRSVSTGTPNQYWPRKRFQSTIESRADFFPRSSGKGRSDTSPDRVTKAGLSIRRVTVNTLPFSSSSSEKSYSDNIGCDKRLDELVSFPPRQKWITSMKVDLPSPF